MKRKLRGIGLCGLLVAAAAAAAAQAPARTEPKRPARPAGAAAARIILHPRLVPGEVRRYRIELQTTSATTRGGIIQEEQAPGQLVVTWDALIRLEVLGRATQPAPPPGGKSADSAGASAHAASAPALRLRTTYEESGATIQSDTPDPDSETIQQQYAKLKGHSIEFTLGADGRVSDVQGLDNVVSQESALQIADQWTRQLSGGASLPPEGIAQGQMWSSAQPAPSLPLAGMAWRTNSTYVRDEPCPVSTAFPANGTAAPNSAKAPSQPATGGEAGEMCAVIVSAMTLIGPRSSRDPTPPEYKRNGLRTAGTWTGSGENTSYVSLKSGWVVSVAQTGTEEMNVVITNQQENNIRYSGRIDTRSQVTLIPAAAARAQ